MDLVSTVFKNSQITVTSQFSRTLRQPTTFRTLQGVVRDPDGSTLGAERGEQGGPYACVARDFWGLNASALTQRSRLDLRLATVAVAWHVEVTAIHRGMTLSILAGAKA